MPHLDLDQVVSICSQERKGARCCHLNPHRPGAQEIHPGREGSSCQKDGMIDIVSSQVPMNINRHILSPSSPRDQLGNQSRGSRGRD